ncbi:MAG: hypothetical protein ACKORL_01760, partial [Phycisphaerales bacterium]
MSKQAQKVRVSQLAKDLGVDWKLIKAKCESEGIDQAKTASSTVSIGLAETIREWFGTGGTATAIETAPKIEVPAEAPAAKRPVRKKKAEGEAAAPAAVEAAAPAAPAAPTPAPVATPAPAPVAAPVAPKPVAPKPVAPKPVAPVLVEPMPTDAELDLAPRAPGEDPAMVVSPESAAPHAVVDAPQSPAVIGKAHRSTKPAPAPAKPAAPAVPPPTVITKPPVKHTIQPATAPPTMNVPRRPEVVRTVGQTLTPQKTALSGPKVIRVEQPEVLPTPRPRTAPPGGAFGNRLG